MGSLTPQLPTGLTPGAGGAPVQQGASWLNQLAADHAPPPVGFWPPAPGWWLLAVLVLVLVLIAIGLLIRALRQPSRRLRQAGLAELKAVERDNDDALALALAVSNLMRRYAIVRYGRDQVARLHGQAWLDFVAEHGGQALSGAPGEALLQAVYAGRAPAPDQDLPAVWLKGARGFIACRRQRAASAERVRSRKSAAATRKAPTTGEGSA